MRMQLVSDQLNRMVDAALSTARSTEWIVQILRTVTSPQGRSTRLPSESEAASVFSKVAITAINSLNKHQSHEGMQQHSVSPHPSGRVWTWMMFATWLCRCPAVFVLLVFRQTSNKDSKLTWVISRKAASRRMAGTLNAADRTRIKEQCADPNNHVTDIESNKLT